MEFLKKMKLEYVLQAIVMIIIGIVLIVWTQASLDMMARALAVLLFVIGVIFIGTYLFKKQHTSFDSGQLIFGVIITAIGCWIFLNPGAFTDFIPKLFGVFILLSGVKNLMQTFSLIKYQYGYWWLSLIFAIITVILGGFLLFNPTSAKEIAVTVIGVFLVYDGISNLWTLSRVAKYADAVSQTVQDAEAVDVTATIVDVDDKNDPV